MRNLKQIVLEAPGRLNLVQAHLPGSPGPGEALVRVLRVGICGTDLHAFQGNQPFIRCPIVLGHELAVEVSALGQGTDGLSLSVGDRCTVLPYLSDGTCGACRRGRENCCEALRVLGVHIDGGMREAFILPAAQLLPANDLSNDVLALVEMLAIGAHAVRRAAITPADTVLVIGAGPIGLSSLAFARVRKARAVVTVDIAPERLTFARELGLAETIDGNAEKLPQILRDKLGDLPTVVMDATGNARSMERAVSLVAHGGRLVLIGHTRNTLSFENPVIHQREISLLCSRNATREDFDEVLQAVRDEHIDVASWITTRADPDTLVGDLPTWTQPEKRVIKAVMEFG